MIINPVCKQITRKLAQYYILNPRTETVKVYIHVISHVFISIGTFHIKTLRFQSPQVTTTIAPNQTYTSYINGVTILAATKKTTFWSDLRLRSHLFR